ncbi:DUF2141 domain-containing protein [Pseudotenacibaculum sp. MALMAid0570]|uniref:DUF2141 domain-containing protein n=1 Tax=Pseudotenacibaculum sp. MALMAid0570 TaxID=3143938 RepID=UPI0032DFA345
MKILATILIATTILTGGLMSNKKQKVTATVVNVTSNDGKVAFALYNKDSFMKVPLQSKNAKIVDGKSTVVFEGVEPGEYAIICFHDKNDNDKMDFQENGMPMEDYGASNNVMSFGPPQYDDAKFTVSDKEVTLEIKF